MSPSSAAGRHVVLNVCKNLFLSLRGEIGGGRFLVWPCMWPCMACKKAFLFGSHNPRLPRSRETQRRFPDRSLVKRRSTWSVSDFYLSDQYRLWIHPVDPLRYVTWILSCFDNVMTELSLIREQRHKKLLSIQDCAKVMQAKLFSRNVADISSKFRLGWSYRRYFDGLKRHLVRKFANTIIRTGHFSQLRIESWRNFACVKRHVVNFPDHKTNWSLGPIF